MKYSVDIGNGLSQIGKMTGGAVGGRRITSRWMWTYRNWILLKASWITFPHPGDFSFSFVSPASSFFPPQRLFAVRSMLMFLFYSILLFSQVKNINYSSIFDFQSFFSPRSFRAKCLSAVRASKQGVLRGETIWQVLTIKPLSLLPRQEFERGKKKANRGGSPRQ